VPSRRALAGLLLGCLLLAHPLVGNGPGADTRYDYATTELDLADDEAVEDLYHHPTVDYGTEATLDAVRTALDERVTRPESATSSSLRELRDRRYVADDVRDRYYRVNASVADGQFRLRAETVSADAVARALAVETDAAPAAVRDAFAGDRTAPRRADATVIARNGSYVLVRPTETRRVADPYVVPKVIGYAVGVALVIGAIVDIRYRRDQDGD